MRNFKISEDLKIQSDNSIAQIRSQLQTSNKNKSVQCQLFYQINFSAIETLLCTFSSERFSKSIYKSLYLHEHSHLLVKLGKLQAKNTMSTWAQLSADSRESIKICLYEWNVHNFGWNSISVDLCFEQC